MICQLLHKAVANILLDELERRPSAPAWLVQVEKYGEILNFFSYYYEGRSWWLACVKWIGRCLQQRETLKLPTVGYRSSETAFVEVTALDRCIGLYKCGRVEFVLDNELVLGSL